MKKVLLLLIIPFLSFGQCEDESACNYYYAWEWEDCQYPGDYGCMISDYYPDGTIYYYFPAFPEYYMLDENCNCIQASFCEDEEACNYGASFEGWEFLEPNAMIVEVLGEYDEAPFCVSPGDSCNVLAPLSILPLPTYTLDGQGIEIGFGGFEYSGLFDENCNCICTNPENIFVFDQWFSEIISFDECPLFGCINVSACNYNPDATENDGSCILPGGNCVSDNGNPGIYNIACECVEIVSSINEVISDKKIITKINILGRETTNKEGFQLHIYDDGTVEKKYLIK